MNWSSPQTRSACWLRSGKSFDTNKCSLAKFTIKTIFFLGYTYLSHVWGRFMACLSVAGAQVKVFKSDLQYSHELPLRVISGSNGRLDGSRKTIAWIFGSSQMQNPFFLLHNFYSRCLMMENLHHKSCHIPVVVEIMSTCVWKQILVFFFFLWKRHWWRNC